MKVPIPYSSSFVSRGGNFSLLLSSDKVLTIYGDHLSQEQVPCYLQVEIEVQDSHMVSTDAKLEKDSLVATHSARIKVLAHHSNLIDPS